MKYTVFIRRLNNKGTTFVSSATADTQQEAVEACVAECADCWECDECDLHVLGVAAGDVEILEWDDLI